MDARYPYSVEIIIRESGESNIFTEKNIYGSTDFYGYRNSRETAHRVVVQIDFEELGILKKALERIRLDRLKLEAKERKRAGK